MLFPITSLVTNFFCRFGVPRELNSDQGRNFKSRLIQILQRLGASETSTTPLHPQSHGMVELYIKTVEEHLEKLVASHQMDWGTKLPIPPCLQVIHSRHYGLDPGKPSVRKRTPLALRPTVWSTLRQGTTHNRLSGKFIGPFTRQIQFCPSTP
jgi:hypothetical protein